MSDDQPTEPFTVQICGICGRKHPSITRADARLRRGLITPDAIIIDGLRAVIEEQQQTIGRLSQNCTVHLMKRHEVEAARAALAAAVERVRAAATPMVCDCNASSWCTAQNAAGVDILAALDGPTDTKQGGECDHCVHGSGITTDGAGCRCEIHRTPCGPACHEGDQS